MTTRNLVAVLVAFVVVVGAYVGLTITGHPTGDLFALVTPFLAALGVTAVVNKRTDEQNAVISQIAENTNGVLDTRIRTAVRAELDAARQLMPKG